MSIKLTPIEAANRQLCTAIHMLFGGGDPVSIHSLASNAREIYERACMERQLTRFFDYAVDAHPHATKKELADVLNKSRNFFKHLVGGELEFDKAWNDSVILFAAHDCQELCGDDTPIEARIFLAWTSATHEALMADLDKYEPADEYLTFFDTRVPGLRTAQREEKIRFGRALLDANMQP